MKTFPHSRYDTVIAETVQRIVELGRIKGGEYAGDVDRLANFRRNAERIGLNMESVWHTYCAKHWDAIEQYVQDLNTGKVRPRAESLSSRVDDIIVYLLLLKCLLIERNEAAADDMKVTLAEADIEEAFTEESFSFPTQEELKTVEEPKKSRK